MSETEANCFLLETASQRITKSASWTLAAFHHDGTVIGAVDILFRAYNQQFRPTHAHVESLLVEEGLRGQGIGTMLMCKVVEYAKGVTESQITTITLNVDSENVDAIKFYDQIGFAIDEKLWNGQYFMTKPIG